MGKKERQKSNLTAAYFPSLPLSRAHTDSQKIESGNLPGILVIPILYILCVNVLSKHMAKVYRTKTAYPRKRDVAGRLYRAAEVDFSLKLAMKDFKQNS